MGQLIVEIGFVEFFPVPDCLLQVHEDVDEEGRGKEQCVNIQGRSDLEVDVCDESLKIRIEGEEDDTYIQRPEFHEFIVFIFIDRREVDHHDDTDGKHIQLHRDEKRAFGCSIIGGNPNLISDQQAVARPYDDDEEVGTQQCISPDDIAYGVGDAADGEDGSDGKQHEQGIQEFGEEDDEECRLGIHQEHEGQQISNHIEHDEKAVSDQSRFLEENQVNDEYDDDEQQKDDGGIGVEGVDVD